MMRTKLFKRISAAMISILIISGFPASAFAADTPALSVSDPKPAAELVSTLVGSGITTSNATTTGAAAAFAVFASGTAIVGFESGVILSTGKAKDVIGPNTVTNKSTQWGTSGDQDLYHINGDTTYDAAVLQFDFTPDQSTINFQYVLSSDEYPESVQYADLFAIFVNGTNCALIPGTTSPVSIGTINQTTNSGWYVSNADYSKNTAMDGLTKVLTATANVTPGAVNHIKFAIADKDDKQVDSNVFIRAGSVSTGAPSSDAGLSSVLGQGITAGSEAGTLGDPKTASISVSNGVSAVSASDIVKHDEGANVTFYGTDSGFATPAAGNVNLTEGAGTNVYIKITAADNTPLYYKVTINRAAADSGSGHHNNSTQSSDTGFEISVNGNTETAATATTAQVGGQSVTTVTMDDKKIEEKLKDEGNNAKVTIPVNTGSDVVVGQLSGQTVKNMENKEAVLEIKTGNVTYTLPASQINIDNVSSEIGQQVALSDIKVNVSISAAPQDTAKIVQDTANKNNYQVVVKPVEFNITCTNGSKTVDVSKFNGYVERMVAIPDGIDPSKITTGIVLNSDGTFSHVPTKIVNIDGKYYAKINSLTNSTYSVIWSPKTFTDVENSWAKDAVNDMGSRLVIGGVGNDKFEPNRDITRGEFAAIVVRALGLMHPGTGKASFTDVSKTDWYFDAVSIAYENGIISGFGNGKFGPSDKITREQAMTMIAKAMKITELKTDLKADEAAQLLAAYGDSGKASAWAKDSIASCISTGVVSGRSGNLVAPKDDITRAEVAVIVQRLLQKSSLI